MPPPHASLGLRPVTAVLGPTNTGKTHFALERMSAHSSGMIGLPLRLLAREVYDKMAARHGTQSVALVTGEEKVIPRSARYFVCTVEAMPLEREVSFLAIDEVQLAADPERGRVFTDRLLHARGRDETLMLGSDTMRAILQRLIPDIGFETRERFSQLTYEGYKKVTRLPRRSAIVAFSADNVYAIAELIRRQRGGAAVVMGALSPRTRNAQAELYNAGEVDYLVATDAIGMGLNMDIDHVAFAAGRKFDGKNARDLYASEVAQIAGRAGRYTKDGTWGETADLRGFTEDVIEQVDLHRFEPVTQLQWRNDRLKFGSLPALLHSLEQRPPRPELVRARMGDDEEALRRLTRRHDVRDMARGGAALRLLWDVCQVPDFRKVTPDQHAVMLGEVYHQLLERGRIREEFVSLQLQRLSSTDGDVDALSTRIAHVRTWTYLSHRPGWIERAGHWQGEARRIEDALSDALHERLTARFVDRRTSVLLKRLKDDAPLLAGVNEEGEVVVEGEFVGRLIGFQFALDPRARGPHERSVRYAALKALRPELAARAGALAGAKPDELTLTDQGTVTWRGSEVARLSKGPQPLRPEVRLVATEHMPPNALPAIEERVRDFVAERVEGLAGPLVSLQKAVNRGGEDTLSPGARGVAFQLIENFGAVSRRQVASEVKALDQKERAGLRDLGVRFGEYTIHLPALLKPAPAQFLALLWSLWTETDPSVHEAPKAGATSVPLDEAVPAPLYHAYGYRPSGERAVRIDMLERLAQEIRKAREGAGKQGFEATQRMMSLLGVSGEPFESVLKSLGYKKDTVTRPVATAAPEAPKAEDAAKVGAEAQPPLQTVAPVTGEPSPEPVAPTVGEEATLAPAASAATAEPVTPDHAAAEAETPHAEAASAGATPTPTEDAASPETGEAPSSPVSAPAEAAEAETETVTLWRWAPPQRRQQGPRKAPRRDDANGKGRDEKGRNERGQDRRGPKGARKGPGGSQGRGKGKPQGPRTFTAGPDRKGKKVDPDNPFAVLAALKDKD